MVSMAIPAGWSEGETHCSQIEMPKWECLRGMGGNLWGDRREGVRGGLRGQEGLHKRAKRVLKVDKCRGSTALEQGGCNKWTQKELKDQKAKWRDREKVLEGGRPGFYKETEKRL